MTVGAIDSISDSASGIALMFQLDEWVSERSDVLDEVGILLLAS